MTRQSASLRFSVRCAAVLLGSLILSPVQAAGEQAGDPAHNSASTLSDLQQLQNESRQNAVELDALKETVTNQNRLIEELKHNNETSAPPVNNEVAALKSKVDQQGQAITQLQAQLNELKRNADPSGNSSAGELSSLRQEISNLRSSVGRLDSQVSSLSSKVK